MSKSKSKSLADKLFEMVASLNAGAQEVVLDLLDEADHDTEALEAAFAKRTEKVRSFALSKADMTIFISDVIGSEISDEGKRAIERAWEKRPS